MRLYICFDKATGEISRSGRHSDETFSAVMGKAAKSEIGIMEGRANDLTQKVIFDGLDESGQPINPRIVKKEEVVSRIQKGGEDK